MAIQLIKIEIRDVNAGDNVTVMTPSNLYECELGNNVFIGPFVEIQKGCQIGSGSKIQSHTFICEGVTVGNNCFIGHNVTFANDLFQSGSPDPNSKKWITISLGDNVSIGSGATILCSHICSGTVIGAGSVVVKSIQVKGIYAGNPAKLLRLL